MLLLSLLIFAAPVVATSGWSPPVSPAALQYRAERGISEFVWRLYPRLSDGSVDIPRLLQVLTIQEKAAQLDLTYGWLDLIAYGIINATGLSTTCGGHGCGAIHDFYPSMNTGLVNEIVDFHLSGQGGPSKIPPLFAEECLHGGAGNRKTVFPTPLTSAASFNADLLQKIGRAIGQETRASGVVQCFAPVIGLAREPRWGRCEETYGEDTYLTSRYTVAMVLGMQGDDPTGRGLYKNTSVIAEPKHFVAHSSPQSGINTSPVMIGRRDLISTYMEPFRAAVVEAGARGIMTAYHELDGIPMTASREYLTDWLRTEWGFDGWVLSDLGAVRRLIDPHAVAAHPADAIAQWLEAGGNCQYYDFPSNVYQSAIVDMVNNGSLELSVVDARVTDMLNIKKQLGLFDNPHWNPALLSNIDTPEHRAVALQAAREGIVLLQNNHSTLPLKPSALHRVAVIGPSADFVRLGDYAHAGKPEIMTTVLEGVQAVGTAYGFQTLYADGCGIRGEEETYPIRKSHYVGGIRAEYYNATDCSGSPFLVRNESLIAFDWYAYGVSSYYPDERTGPAGANSSFCARFTGTFVSPMTPKNNSLGRLNINIGNKEPVKLTVNGEVTIDTWTRANGSNNVPFSFEKGKRYSFELLFSRNNTFPAALHLEWNLFGDCGICAAVETARQSDLAILVVGDDNEIDGEGHDRNDLSLPGKQEQLIEQVAATGVPVVVVLMNGRPITISSILTIAPAVLTAGFAGQSQGTAVAEVLFGQYNPAGRLPMTWPRTVGDVPVYYSRKPSAGRWPPLFPFGFGLSYTTFSYSPLELSATHVPVNGLLNVTVTVKNVGTVDGDEVPQLYVRDVLSSVTTPYQQLKGFSRVRIPAGQSTRVTWTIDVTRDLWLIDRSFRRVVEPGEFFIAVGPHSGNSLINATFHVTN